MKKTVHIVLFLSLFLQNKNLKAQSWIWDTITTSSNASKKMCKDASNNIYRYTQDTLDKINSAGQLLWQKAFPGDMLITGMDVAPDRNFYLCGIFDDTLTYGGNSYISKGSSDIWVAKYDSNGSLQWLKTAGSKGYDEVKDICANGTGFAITGLIQDTVSFMGQVFPKFRNEDLFVASISGNGSLQAFKSSAHTTTTNSFYNNSVAHGLECDADAAGNIYVLGYSYGENRIDTFRIGAWGPYPTHRFMNYSVTKFNSQLQPQYVNIMEQCMNYCDDYYDLEVNQAGECYLISRYSYGQSGNDDDWGTLYKISTTGSLTAKYRHREDRNSFIGDIDLDECSNVYFTGLWRTSGYQQPSWKSMITGQLSPSLTLNWLWQDSTYSNFVIGKSLAVLGVNDLFVTGIYNDTIQLLNTLTTGTDWGGFYGRITAPGAVLCNTATTIGEEEETALYLYPNPSTGIIHFTEMIGADKVWVYSILGSLVHSQKVPDKTMDLSSLNEGIYFVKLANDKKVFKTEKLILKK